MSTSKSSNPEEQLAHGEFIEQTPDDNDNDGTPENNDDDGAPDAFLQYWLNDEDEELEKKKTSTPSAPGDIDVSGGGTDTEKAGSTSNRIISRLKSTVSTVTRKVSGALSNISPHCHDVTKILPSNETNKTTDTEGVELSSYPDSSGAIDSPPEVEMLVGGNNARENQRKRDHCLMVDATFNYHVPQK